MDTNIAIKDTASVISSAEELNLLSFDIDSARESIEHILNEVKEYWEQTQQDAQTFSTGLEKNVESLKSITECNKEFSVAVRNYAEKQESTSQQSVS